MATSLFLFPSASQASSACVAQNNLSTDSFEIASGGVLACLEGRVPCRYADNKLAVQGLDVPVETLKFVFKDYGAHTKSLVGFGQPDLRGSEAGVVLRIKNLPREITMEQALRAVYGLPGAKELPCDWATDEAPLGQFLTGTVKQAACDSSNQCKLWLQAESGRDYVIVAGAGTQFAQRYLDAGTLEWLNGSLVRFHLSGLQVIRGKKALKRLDAAPGEAYRLIDLISFYPVP